MEKEIDLILIECRDDQLVSTNFGISDIRRKAIQKANILRLIQPRNAHSYELTEKGLEALKHGGISQYDDFIKIKESKDAEIKELTIKQLKGNIFQIKYWWIFLIINGIIAFVTGNFTLIKGWFK